MYDESTIQIRFLRLDFRFHPVSLLVFSSNDDYLRRCRKSNRIRERIRAKLRRTNSVRNLCICSSCVQSVRSVSKAQGIAVSVFKRGFFCLVFWPCYFFFLYKQRQRTVSSRWRSCFPSTRMKSAGTMIIVQLLLIAASFFGLQRV